MKGIAAGNVRNFTIAGHSGSGKTLLADTFLFKSGKVSRVGKVEDKTSVSDYRSEEHEKGQSLYATPLHCTWKDTEFFFIDSPGNSDFLGETTAALQVCDAALVVIDCHSGIEFGTMRAMKIARERGCPRAIYVNAVDRDNSDFFQVLNDLQEAYGATTCVPFTLPVGQSGSFSAVHHVLRGSEVPAELADQAEKYRTALLDTAAESDEELMMRYLDGEELTEQEIAAGLHAAIEAGSLIPVFCGSAAKDIGLDELMNGIVNLFPTPLAAKSMATADDSDLEISESGDALAFVFKSVNDPYIGQLTYMRVYTGTLTADADLHNTTRGSKERAGGLLVTNGKEQESIDAAPPGAVVAIAKLKGTHINDTLVSGHSKVQAKPITFPKPTASFAVYAVKKGEDEKIITALHRINEEDQSMKIDHNEETGESLLYGLGDQHIHVIVDKVKQISKVDVDLRKPKVPYRETITKPGDGKYRHKKQTGGHGQFAEVYLKIEPTTEVEFEFANEVVGGNIPKNYIPGVEKGVVDAMKRGPLARCKVINIRAAVYDGKYHPVDSSDMAFQIAGRGAFREAMAAAAPILLEPIMKVSITTPDQYMGDIHGDLNSRRGRILGMNADEGMQVINAEVPLGELHAYSSSLRSITQGRGSFDMEFIRYEQVPSNVAKVIQEAASHEELDEE